MGLVHFRGSENGRDKSQAHLGQPEGNILRSGEFWNVTKAE